MDTSMQGYKVLMKSLFLAQDLGDLTLALQGGYNNKLMSLKGVP